MIQRKILGKKGILLTLFFEPLLESLLSQFYMLIYYLTNVIFIVIRDFYTMINLYTIISTVATVVKRVNV